MALGKIECLPASASKLLAPGPELRIDGQNRLVHRWPGSSIRRNRRIHPDCLPVQTRSSEGLEEALNYHLAAFHRAGYILRKTPSIPRHLAGPSYLGFRECL